MSTQLNNFTATVVSFEETAGVDVTIATPSVTILLEPNIGYTINASNFSSISPLPAEVNSITFSQNGANVTALVVFTPLFIMPSANVSLPLCIEGLAELIVYTVNGSISNNVCNISTAIPASYSDNGNYNETSNILTLPVSADPGYYFTQTPVLELSTGISSNYTITNTKTFDINGNLIGIEFSVYYKFPNINVSGDILNLEACAYEIYTPVAEITGYSINTSAIIPDGEIRTLSVFGNEGAEFSVTLDGIDVITNVIMGSTGIYTVDLVFPEVTVNTTYEIELLGDLATPFLQTNPFTIKQLVNTEVTIDVLFNSDIAGITPVIKSYLPLSSPDIGSSAYNISVTFDIIPFPVLSGTQELSLISQPTEANWSNLDPITNGGTDIYIEAIVNLEDPAATGSITVTGFIDFYGSENMTTVLDLTSLLTITGNPAIPCSSVQSSGGGGVTDYTASLSPEGGLLAFLFNPQGLPDKLEIIHGAETGVKKATSGMNATDNYGPFDDVYGTEITNTIPTLAETNSIPQFIGTYKGAAATRLAEFTAETGYEVPSLNIGGINYQQVIWWTYSDADYLTNDIATIRITGPTGTVWDLIRLCCPDGNCIVPTPPIVTYNSVVEVTDCTTATGVATTIVEESNIVVGTQLVSTSGGSLTDLPIGFYRLSNDLTNGQTYNLGDIPITTYIIQVDNNGAISAITEC